MPHTPRRQSAAAAEIPNDFSDDELVQGPNELSEEEKEDENLESLKMQLIRTKAELASLKGIVVLEQKNSDILLLELQYTLARLNEGEAVLHQRPRQAVAHAPGLNFPIISYKCNIM